MPLTPSLPAPATSARPVARASRREDLVAVAAGAWIVIALFSDGWAHANVPELESFFTPWHAGLYSGFAAAAGWIAGLVLRRGAAPATVLRAPLSAVRLLPAGYPAAAAGVATVGAGGVLDMLWHRAFGVEEGLDALLSPSHLTLLTGAALLLSAPARGAWRSAGPLPTGFRARFPELLSLALTTALIAFFTVYTSAFARPGVDQPLVRIPHGMPGHELAELAPAATLAAYLLTTALIVVPLLLLSRRAPLPAGATTLLVATPVWLTAGLQGFSRPGVALAVTAAAVAADAVLTRLDRTRGASAPGRLMLQGAVVPALLWPAQLAAVHVTDAVRYPVALWTGVVFLAVLLGLVLGALAAGERR